MCLQYKEGMMNNYNNLNVNEDTSAKDTNVIAKTKSLKSKNTRLMVFALVLGVALIAFVVLYAISMSRQTQLKIDLENIYQKNFYPIIAFMLS